MLLMLLGCDVIHLHVLLRLCQTCANEPELRAAPECWELRGCCNASGNSAARTSGIFWSHEIVLWPHEACTGALLSKPSVDGFPTPAPWSSLLIGCVCRPVNAT